MAAVDPILEAMWKQVLDDWDDDARHAKLVGFGQEHSRLGEVASLYKTAAHPDGSPYRLSSVQIDDAKKRLNGITMLAVMTLEAGKSEPGKPKGVTAIRLLAALLLVAAIASAAYLLQKG
jgi:hypothetical protein